MSFPAAPPSTRAFAALSFFGKEPRVSTASNAASSSSSSSSNGTLPAPNLRRGGGFSPFSPKAVHVKISDMLAVAAANDEEGINHNHPLAHLRARTQKNKSNTQHSPPQRNRSSSAPNVLHYAEQLARLSNSFLNMQPEKRKNSSERKSPFNTAIRPITIPENGTLSPNSAGIKVSPHRSESFSVGPSASTSVNLTISNSAALGLTPNNINPNANANNNPAQSPPAFRPLPRLTLPLSRGTSDDESTITITPMPTPNINTANGIGIGSGSVASNASSLSLASGSGNASHGHSHAHTHAHGHVRFAVSPSPSPEDRPSPAPSPSPSNALAAAGSAGGGAPGRLSFGHRGSALRIDCETLEPRRGRSRTTIHDPSNAPPLPTETFQDWSEVHEVFPRLFLTNFMGASSLKKLQTARITHILNAAMELPNVFPQHFKYKKLEILDRPSFNIKEFFPDAITWIEDTLASNDDRRVCVHCAAGSSRSAALVIAYIMYTKRMKYLDAFRLVKMSRGACAPNHGFVVQLFAFEKSKWNIWDNSTVPPSTPSAALHLTLNADGEVDEKAMMNALNRRVSDTNADENESKEETQKRGLSTILGGKKESDVSSDGDGGDDDDDEPVLLSRPPSLNGVKFSPAISANASAPSPSASPASSLAQSPSPSSNSPFYPSSVSSSAAHSVLHSLSITNSHQSPKLTPSITRLRVSSTDEDADADIEVDPAGSGHADRTVQERSDSVSTHSHPHDDDDSERSIRKSNTPNSAGSSGSSGSTSSLPASPLPLACGSVSVSSVSARRESLTVVKVSGPILGSLETVMRARRASSCTVPNANSNSSASANSNGNPNGNLNGNRSGATRKSSSDMSSSNNNQSE